MAMTHWERVCKNLGLDPLSADPSALKSLGPKGYTGEVETTCRRCGLEIVGQHARCLSCEGKW